MYYIFCDNIYLLLGLEISVMMMCFLLLLGFFWYMYYDGFIYCGLGLEWDGCSDILWVKVNYIFCSWMVVYLGIYDILLL